MTGFSVEMKPLSLLELGLRIVRKYDLDYDDIPIDLSVQLNQFYKDSTVPIDVLGKRFLDCKFCVDSEDYWELVKRAAKRDLNPFTDFIYLWKIACYPLYLFDEVGTRGELYRDLSNLEWDIVYFYLDVKEQVSMNRQLVC